MAGETYHAVHLDLVTRKFNMVLVSVPTDFLFNWCERSDNKRVVCSIRHYDTLRTAHTGAGFRRHLDGRTTFTRLLAANADGSQDLQLIWPATIESVVICNGTRLTRTTSLAGCQMTGHAICISTDRFTLIRFRGCRPLRSTVNLIDA